MPKEMANVSGLTVLYMNSSGPYLPRRKGDGQSVFQSWSMLTTARHIPQLATALSCCSLGENRTFLLTLCWSVAANVTSTLVTLVTWSPGSSPSSPQVGLGESRRSISNMHRNSGKPTMPHHSVLETWFICGNEPRGGTRYRMHGNIEQMVWSLQGGFHRRELQLCPVGLSPPQDDPESPAEQCAHQYSSSMDTDGEFLFLLNPRRTSAVPQQRPVPLLESTPPVTDQASAVQAPGGDLIRLGYTSFSNKLNTAV